jgi:hypothetical protein
MTSVLSVVLIILQIVLALINLGILIFAFTKFVSSPRVNLEATVKALQLEVESIKKELLQKDQRNKLRDDALEVILRSSIALIEFEIQYCLVEDKQPTEELKRAKADLNEFLSKR